MIVRSMNTADENAASAGSGSAERQERGYQDGLSTGSSNLRRRLLTAAVGIPVVLLTIIFGGVTGVSALALAAALMAGYELSRMAKLRGPRRIALMAVPVLLTAVGAVIAASGSWVGDGRPIDPTGYESWLWWAMRLSDWSLLAGIIALALSALLLAAATVARDSSRGPRLMACAAIWFGLLLAHAPLAVRADHLWVRGVTVDTLPPIHSALAHYGGGSALILIAVLGVFASDTGAYAVGRIIGRHKLAPGISPGKTVEGLIGGVVLCAVAVTALGLLLDPLQNYGDGLLLPDLRPLRQDIQIIDLWVWTLLGVTMGLIAAGGDLAVSWLKRRAEVKDSGRALPGHGGILDRIDSLAPSLALVFWAGILISSWYWPTGGLSFREPYPIPVIP